MTVQVGAAAPDFTLPAHTGNKVSLSSFKGRKTVIAFLPFAFTGGCTNQVCGFRDNYAGFKDLNVEILQISTDPSPSQKAWSESKESLPFPLLSDFWPHGAVGKAYGVFNEERGMEKRAAFILDEQGIVRFAKVYDPGTIPESKDLLAELKKI